MADNKTQNGLKHRAIEDVLLARIEGGRFKVGERLYTGMMIAKEFNVSRPTADKAVTNLVTRGYLERIQGLGTFVRDWRADEQDIARANSIALIASADHVDGVPFCGLFMHSASLAADRKGYHLAFCALTDSQDYCAPTVISNKQAVGNLILDELTEHQAEVLLEQDVPHLFVGNHRNTFGFPVVRYGMVEAGYQITRGLLELERGPIWLLIEPTATIHYAQELLIGYQRALMERPDPVYRLHMGGENEQPSAYEDVTAQMVASGAEHFCIVTHYVHVVGLMAQLERAGIGPDQTTIVVVDRCRRDWRFAERLCLCECAPGPLAEEAVGQIIGAGGDRSLVTGKSYKLQVEQVDDRRKPLRFSWQ